MYVLTCTNLEEHKLTDAFYVVAVAESVEKLEQFLLGSFQEELAAARSDEESRYDLEYAEQLPTEVVFENQSTEDLPWFTFLANETSLYEITKVTVVP